MKKIVSAICIMSLCSMSSYASDYVPDIAEFNGASSISIEPDPVLSLEDGNTIEFWATPDWTEELQYDPVMVSNAGEQGPSYIVAMLRDRSGIGVVSGDKEVVAAFDFTDGVLHHIAIVQGEGHLAIFIDGKTRLVTPMSYEKLPSSGFWIGTADGKTSPFMGALAQLRIWNTALDLSRIIEFSGKDIFPPDYEDHPAIDHLVAISDFSNRDLLISLGTK